MQYFDSYEQLAQHYLSSLGKDTPGLAILLPNERRVDFYSSIKEDTSRAIRNTAWLRSLTYLYVRKDLSYRILSNEERDLFLKQSGLQGES